MIKFFKTHGIRLAQWVFFATVVVLILKLIMLVLPKLSVLATVTICLVATVLLACAYILQLTRDTLRLQDKLQEVYQEQEKLQPMIASCIKMHQSAIQKILDLKHTLALYDNADMKQMVNVLIACENATSKTADSFAYISALFSELVLEDRVKNLPTPPEFELPSTANLSEADRKAINDALFDAELFKE